jgi:NNP family nitrate/nitrite transporter-like MFS transporter
MEIFSPGEGIMATRAGTVTESTSTHIVVDGKRYDLKVSDDSLDNLDESLLVFPTKSVWQEPVVEVGEEVSRRQLLAKGVTRIYFQANVWIFAGLVIVLGSVWGIGKAAVYKHIPDYYPDEVGVVGGMVGVIGGLGGFFCPILFAGKYRAVDKLLDVHLGHFGYLPVLDAQRRSGSRTQAATRDAKTHLKRERFDG